MKQGEIWLINLDPTPSNHLGQTILLHDRVKNIVSVHPELDVLRQAQGER